MKLSDLKAGDIVTIDSGFTCMKAGNHLVHSDVHGQLFLKCDDGRHYLDGQEDFDTGELIGIVAKEKANGH